MTPHQVWDLGMVVLALLLASFWRAEVRARKRVEEGWDKTLSALEAEVEGDRRAWVTAYTLGEGMGIFPYPHAEPSHPGPYEDLPTQPAPAPRSSAWRARLTLGLLRVGSWVETTLRWLVG